MKIILLLLAGCCVLLISCNLLSSRDQVRDFIAGTYTTAWTTDFTEARDTVVIEPSVKAGSGTYQITRRTYMFYHKKPQYRLVHWTGTFNSRDKTIIINNNERILSFDPVAKEMKMGSTVYKKV